MKITVFTCNQPRHISLIESLSAIADVVYVVQEANTVMPGRVQDFYHKSPVMEQYFQRVLDAEHRVFGAIRFGPENMRCLALKSGDLDFIDMACLAPALSSDFYVVFGASFIKGDLCNFLIDRNAVNVHMGVSPYYRGSSTNFWALYDCRPDYVGATIHYLSLGLDSGPILFHALPKADAVDPFLLGMLAVRVAHAGLVHCFTHGGPSAYAALPQDRSKEIRYSRNSEFTDAIATEYIDRLLTPTEVLEALAQRDVSAFIRPFIG